MTERGLEIGTYSILGDRSSQQDSFACEREGSILLATVCDGMGGMAGGDQASRVAVRVLADRLHQMVPADLDETPGWMSGAVRAADEEVFRLTDEKGNRLYAGSTCVSVMLENNRFHWSCVGDSRIYLKTGAGMRILTRMHNYQMRLDEKLRRGEISQADWKTESQRGEALISYLGIGGIPILDLSREPITLSQDDIIILCSDGLYKSLEDEQIAAVIEESGKNMELAAKRLCSEAYRLSRRKQDNTTVIAIRYNGAVI